MPPIETLPATHQASEVIRRQYRHFREPTKSPRDVMLTDALALLRIFQKAKPPGDFATLAMLAEVTEGLRTALRKIKEATTP